MTSASSPIITVANLCKDFKIYKRPQDRLWEILLRRPLHQIYHVLDDISFAVAEGKSLGIIGDNGAGKSTLLKILVGTLQPTAGQISTYGQVAALLELGAGFHKDFTGRRNIHLNASLLGVSNEQIHELEADIIAFSELGDFIDRPVKTYSSGMFVRLAFSIATMVRPDILVIDEALSVGDMAFQKKCVQRMNEFRKQKKTMVFCSHSMFHVQELCDIAIWLEKGKIREIGDSSKVVGHYEHACNTKKTYHNINEDISSKGKDSKRSGAKTAVVDQSESASTDTAADSVETQDCIITMLSVQSSKGEELTALEALSDVHLKMEVEILEDNVEGHFGFAFMKSAEEPIASFLTTQFPNVDKGVHNRGDKITISLVVKKLAMRVGDFYVIGGVADKSGLLWYETKWSKLLHVKPNKGVGPILMDSEWRIESK